MLFNQRRGISPAALIIGSTMLIAALSPQIRHRISGFITGQMNRRNSENNTFDASNVGNMVKQAFSGSSGDNQDRSQHQSQRQNGSVSTSTPDSSNHSISIHSLKLGKLRHPRKKDSRIMLNPFILNKAQ